MIWVHIALVGGCVVILVTGWRVVVDRFAPSAESRTVAREPYGTPDNVYVPADWTRS